VPLKDEIAPSSAASIVAELPTCQKTLQGSAPLMSSTLLPVAVTSVLVIWKMKTESGLLAPSSVTVPVIPKVPEAEL
jgi:hypothetical protein